MSDFESAEIYIKEILSIAVEIAIKKLNRSLKNDKVIPNSKILVTGGQAIQKYFPAAKQLRTHDFDLKLVAPSKISYTSTVRDRLLLLSLGVAKFIENNLNIYIEPLLGSIKDYLSKTYNIVLVPNSTGNIFTMSSNLRNNYLKVVSFKMKQGKKIRTNSICDIYVVDPVELDHYLTFTGLPGSNPILSKNKSDYYMPYQEINGIPYAGLGYIIWDSIRMVKYSMEKGLVKYSRYVDKRDAIINALNNPVDNVSCNAMRNFVANCEKEYNICVIDGNKYENINSLIKYGISKGFLPATAKIIEEVKSSYDINYLCESLKRIEK